MVKAAPVAAKDSSKPNVEATNGVATNSTTSSSNSRAPISQNGVKPPGRGGAEAALPSHEVVDEAALDEVAKRLHGFSGREISKLFTSLQTHVLYGMQKSEKGFKRLPKSMLFEVVDSKVVEHERAADFQISGYTYEVCASNPPSVPPTPGQRRPSFARSISPVDGLPATIADAA